METQSFLHKIFKAWLQQYVDAIATAQTWREANPVMCWLSDDMGYILAQHIVWYQATADVVLTTTLPLVALLL